MTIRSRWKELTPTLESILVPSTLGILNQCVVFSVVCFAKIGGLTRLTRVAGDRELMPDSVQRRRMLYDQKIDLPIQDALRVEDVGGNEEDRGYDPARTPRMADL